MTLPLTTRYVKIEAPTSADGGDAFATPTYETTVERTPAHIGAPTSENAGDRFASTDAVLYVGDTVPVPIDARVTDLGTGEVYAALWTASTIGLGLDHRKVGLRRSDGSA